MPKSILDFKIVSILFEKKETTSSFKNECSLANESILGALEKGENNKIDKT